MWGRPALIGLLALFPAPSLASETQPFQIGPWRGGAYADNASGRFSHCSAGAAFGGAFLSFSMTRGRALSVDLSDPDLRPSYGEQTEMDISFDRGEPFRAIGQGAYNGVSAALPENEGAAEALRSGSQMHVVVLGSRFDFDLTSAPELLSGLENCVARNLLPASAGPPPAEEQMFAAAEDRKQVQADRSLTADPTRDLAPVAGKDATSQVSQTTQPPESTGAAPNFVPWPPPMPTASYAYPPDWLRKHRTIGDLSEDIEGVLRKSGYTQFSYTNVPGGFALATRFERIDQIEAPMADITRWAPLAKDVPKSWLDAIKSLFVGRQGRCRLFVFFLTTDNRAPSREEPTVDEATKWSLGGIRHSNLTSSMYC